MNLEKYILGACLYPEVVSDILTVVSVDDFQVETNKRIFSIIETLYQKNVTPDVVTILSEDRTLPSDYMSELLDECFTVANLPYMLTKFKEYVERNRYLKLTRTLNGLDSVDEMRAAIESSLQEKQTTTAEHASKPLKRALDSMEVAFNNRGQITGVPTGIHRVDEELSGLHKTDMILVAARPSIGKTALAVQIAEYACLDKNVPSLFISLEMSSDQLISRMLLSRSKVNVSKARNGLFVENEWHKLTLSAGAINEAKLYIDDCSGVTIEAIAAKAKAAKLKHNIGLLIIDYLGLVSGKGTEYEKITNASQQVKMIAKQVNIPVVCLHQLNRSNLGGRPTMNELRSSGQLEQDADVIILLHREKKEPVEDCELIIEKNRHGKTGIIPQTWNGPINRIEEPKTEYDYAAGG